MVENNTPTPEEVLLNGRSFYSPINMVDEAPIQKGIKEPEVFERGTGSMKGFPVMDMHPHLQPSGAVGRGMIEPIFFIDDWAYHAVKTYSFKAKKGKRAKLRKMTKTASDKAQMDNSTEETTIPCDTPFNMVTIIIPPGPEHAKGFWYHHAALFKTKKNRRAKSRKMRKSKPSKRTSLPMVTWVRWRVRAF